MMRAAPALRVAIVDDEPLARLAVRARLARHADCAIVAEYADGASAAAGLAAERPDLVFIDIDMPGQSGLDVLGGFTPARRPMAILVTAHDNFALRAFALDVIDYLLKPIDDDRFDEALERARRAAPYRAGTAVQAAAQAFTRTFAVRTGARVQLVPADQVERIEADGDYATLHVGGRTYLLRERLHALAGQLDPALFARVHRSAIVRLDMVSEMRALTNRDALLRLRDGTLLRASRTYVPELMAALRGTPATLGAPANSPIAS
jgi:two-component system LytT family response regulator